MTKWKNSKNILNYLFGNGSLSSLDELLEDRRQKEDDYVVFFIDKFFEKGKAYISKMKTKDWDVGFYFDSSKEPTTNLVNKLRDKILEEKKNNLPCAVVGIGGGGTLDIAKAVSNLLTNGGLAEDYQGWDLVKKPGIYKIGIPTLSGTGAEATRTCVMTNYETGLKLGMNSDHTLFDQIILDPELTKTVPRNQFFYTGMDTYIHCIESLAGHYRHPVGDSFSRQAIALCREVFLSDDMMSEESRSKLMVASYLGGMAIANSFVGIVHPFSAGLSIALGTHHCVGNCITMRGMKEFYPSEYEEFWEMVERQKVEIPKGLAKNLSVEKYKQLYRSTVIHEKPLVNALGNHYKDILSEDKVKEIFQRM